MDLPNLAVVLRAALSHVPEERKAAEESLNQLQFTPQHLVRLLQIIVDGSSDMAVRQVASIHFKNFVAKNWSPSDRDEPQKVSESDKSMVRENILGFIVQVPPLLRAQLGESIKTIIHADYPEQWPSLLHWVTHNLESQSQIFGALYVLRVLTRKYEFKSEEDRIPLYYIVEETFPRLLSIFSKLVQIANPPIEVADLIKLICKIFWSSIYLEIPKQLFDPNVFNAWMILFINLLERPVPVEGQPIDPDIRKSWGWWKVKKWTIHILNRLYTRFGDLKLQKSESKTFAQMFQKNYAGQILGCHLQLLNAIRTCDYLPDRVTNLILQYLTKSITKNSMYQMMQPQINIILFEIIFPLMCFNDNDQKLWEEDPHEYVRKGYDIIEDLYSPRTAAMDFVSELVRKRGKSNLQKFIHFIVDIFRRYHEASAEVKPYRQKDGALLAIGTLCDKLKQTDSVAKLKTSDELSIQEADSGKTDIRFKPTIFHSKSLLDTQLELDSPSQIGGDINSKKQEIGDQCSYQKQKRQAESDPEPMEEDGENHRHSRIKTNHQSQEIFPEVSHCNIPNTSQDGICWPLPIHSFQAGIIKDKMQSSASAFDQPQHENLQNSVPSYDQILQNSLTFNEGKLKPHAPVRKKFRPHKKSCSIERVNQVKTTTKQPDSEGNQQRNPSYPIKEDQLNWTVKEIIQGSDHYHRALENIHGTSFVLEENEITKETEKAAAPAFKAPRAQ